MSKKIFIGIALALVAVLTFAGCTPDTNIGEGYGQGRGISSEASAQTGDGSVITPRGGGQGRGQGRGRVDGMTVGVNGFTAEQGPAEDYAALLEEFPAGSLSDAEEAGLIYMREEEKLARDVYAELYSIWNLPIFQSISNSEEQHMSAVGLLLDRYGVEDPVGSNAPGVFTSPELQSLYENLVDQGRDSLASALEVGATIEDLDIFDLQREIEESDNDDIKVVYQNLLKGSRNHMRSFVSQLGRVGETYKASYIGPAYLERILEIVRETATITDPDYVL